MIEVIRLVLIVVFMMGIVTVLAFLGYCLFKLWEWSRK